MLSSDGSRVFPLVQILVSGPVFVSTSETVCWSLEDVLWNPLNRETGEF